MSEAVALSASAPAVSGAEWRDWLALLKPRVVTLVVLTGMVGMLVAPGHLHPVLCLATVLCIAVAAGASGAINMWYERDIDAIMSRTSRRPIPSGKIEPGEALAFGVVLAVASVLVMALATNMVAAAWLALIDRILCLHLYHLVETPHPAEHRHRRRGRGVSAHHRLGRGDWGCQRHAPAALRDRIPVDAAAFLVASPLRLQGLRPGWDSHAAGRCGATPHPDANPALHAGVGTGVDPALAAGLCRCGLWVDRGRAWQRIYPQRRPGVPRQAGCDRRQSDPGRAGSGRLPLFLRPIWRSCLRRSRSIISLVDDFPRPLSPVQAQELRRRQRGRNIALLVVLLAVVALFYAISIVKLSKGGL